MSTMKKLLAITTASCALFNEAAAGFLTSKSEVKSSNFATETSAAAISGLGPFPSSSGTRPNTFAGESSSIATILGPGSLSSSSQVRPSSLAAETSAAAAHSSSRPVVATSTIQIVSSSAAVSISGSSIQFSCAPMTVTHSFPFTVPSSCPLTCPPFPSPVQQTTTITVTVCPTPAGVGAGAVGAVGAVGAAAAAAAASSSAHPTSTAQAPPAAVAPIQPQTSASVSTTHTSSTSVISSSSIRFSSTVSPFGNTTTSAFHATSTATSSTGAGVGVGGIGVGSSTHTAVTTGFFPGTGSVAIPGTTRSQEAATASTAFTSSVRPEVSFSAFAPTGAGGASASTSASAATVSSVRPGFPSSASVSAGAGGTFTLSTHPILSPPIIPITEITPSSSVQIPEGGGGKTSHITASAPASASASASETAAGAGAESSHPPIGPIPSKTAQESLPHTKRSTGAWAPSTEASSTPEPKRPKFLVARNMGMNMVNATISSNVTQPVSNASMPTKNTTKPAGPSKRAPIFIPIHGAD